MPPSIAHTGVSTGFLFFGSTLEPKPIFKVLKLEDSESLSFDADTEDVAFESAFVAESLEAAADIGRIDSFPVYNTVEEFLQATRTSD